MKTMLDPKTFKCNRCGECCNKYQIKLSNKDIKEIKKLGYEEDKFAEYDCAIGCKVLKKHNNECIFIKKKKNEYFCHIYLSRPLVCRRYPFFKKNVESCKPVLFKDTIHKTP